MDTLTAAQRPNPAKARRDVLARCHQAIDDATPLPAHRALLRRLVDSMARDVNGRLSLVMTLPLVVGGAVRGRLQPGDHALTAALTLMETGIYVLDHVLDDEVADDLRPLGQGALLLGATSLISHVPVQLLSAAMGRDLAPALIDMLAGAQASIAAGQLQDVGFRLDEPVAPQVILTAIEGKTGARRALYAAMAARAAGADDARISDFAEFGRALGIARQIRSDLLDLIGEQPGRDLAAGVQTLPIAMHFDAADASTRDAMHQALGLADPVARHQAVLDQLTSSRTVHDVVGLVQDQCARAQALIAGMTAHETGRDALAGFVRQTAFFPLERNPDDR